MGGLWDTKVQQSSSQEHWLSAAMPQGCRALLGGGDRGRRELMRSRRRWRRSWSKRRRRRWEEKEEEGGCCSCIVGASPPPRSSPTPPHLHSNNFLFNSLPFLFPLIIWQQGFFGIKTPLSIIFWLWFGRKWGRIDFFGNSPLNIWKCLPQNLKTSPSESNPRRQNPYASIADVNCKICRSAIHND